MIDTNTAYLIVSILALILSEIAPFLSTPTANGIVHALALALGVIGKSSGSQMAQTISAAALTLPATAIKDPAVEPPTSSKETSPLVISEQKSQ